VHDVTVRRIFGSGVSGGQGNAVLRILHHRRTSGSLADYGVSNLGQQYETITRIQATKALEWLRAHYPIDEARAAQEWAEKEANRVEYNLWLADPENDSKYKDPARVFREQQKKAQETQAEEQEREYEAQLGGKRIGLLHHGRSQFEIQIEQNRRKRLEEFTKKAEEKEARVKEDEVKLATGEWVRTPSGTQLMKPDQTAYVDIFGREQVSRRKEVMAEAQRKSNTSFESETEMLQATSIVRLPTACHPPGPYTDYR
jgi:rhomboid-like protein